MKERRSGGTVRWPALRGRTLSGLALIGLVAAGCSGTPAGPSGSSAGETVVITTLAALNPSVSTQGLYADATVLTERLHLLGDAHASAQLRGRAIVVLGTGNLPVPVGDLVAPGVFQIRPALCQAAAYTPAASGAVTPPLPPGCSSERYSLLTPNLTVESSGNSNADSISPDPVLASYPSSTAAYDDSHPLSPVLVPVSGDGGVRDLLGPALINGAAVASAGAVFRNPSWTVDVTFTRAGASQWDAAAKAYFHEFLAMDVDAQALTVALTQPSQATFTSFAGKVQISGSFTRSAAEQLAAILGSGPLTAPLRP
jgi:hypothetical protein